jgi:hypothetical protein
VKQREGGASFHLKRITGVRNPGFDMIIPLVDCLTKVSQHILACLGTTKIDREVMRP